jgi:hypothetical protein
VSFAASTRSGVLPLVDTWRKLEHWNSRPGLFKASDATEVSRDPDSGDVESVRAFTCKLAHAPCGRCWWLCHAEAFVSLLSP